MVRNKLSSILCIAGLLASLAGCGSGAIQISQNETGAQLVSVSVTPINPTMAKDTSQQFIATGIYSDNTARDVTDSVTWNSTDVNVVTISNDTTGSPAVGLSSSATTKPGHAYAKAVGKTTISATSGDTSGSTTITVTPATLVSIAVTPTNPSIAKGTGQQFVATGTFSDNTTQDLTTQAAWSSSNTAAATISASGSATSIAAGSTTITATSGSVSGSTALTVTPAVLVSLAITPVNPSIAKGNNQQFVATGTYSDNTTQNLTSSVSWGTSNSSVATISNTAGTNGFAVSMATGSTTITAVSGSISGSTTLTVTPAVLASLAVTPPNPSIAKGTSKQFVATGTYSDGSTQILTTSVAWSSSDTGVAQISSAAGSNGLAVSVAVGSATITAASGSVSGSTTLTVTPASLVSIAITPSNPSIAKGTTQQFTATGTYSDGSTQNLTASVTWSSSNTAAAAISNVAGSQGLATSVVAGSTTVTAVSGNISGSVTLTVTQAVLVSLAVTPAAASIAQSATQQFAATGTYSDSTTQTLTASATWSSSNTAVAQISNAAGSQGLATGVGAGTTTITATAGSVYGTGTLTVTAGASGSGTLSWSAPTMYSDGSALSASNIQGYRVYIATAPGAYLPGSYYFVAAPTTSVVVKNLNLASGQYYFVITTLDSNNRESSFSDEVAAYVN